MKRSTKVCWVSFVVSTLVVAAVAGLTIYFTVFRRRGALGAATAPPDDDGTLGPPKQKAGEKSGLFDHRSHAVPGGDYYFVDYAGKGFVHVPLDGSRSHTHFFDEGPPVVIGNITHMVWFDKKSRKVLGHGVRPHITFTRGTHIVGLTVRDNTRDTHSDFTTVHVHSPIFDGAYCYFYKQLGTEVHDDIRAGARPTYARVATTIDFSGAAAYPETFRASPFTMRCAFVSKLIAGTKLSVRHSAPIRLSVDGVPISLDTDNDVSSVVYPPAPSKGTPPNADVPESYIEVILECASGAASCVVALTGGVAKMRHDVSRIVPIVYNVAPATSTKDGGGKVKIHGIGLANHAKVAFGDVEVAPKEVSDDGRTMDVVVPRVSSERRVSIVVKNKNGESPPISFQYSKDGKLPIKFKETELTVPSTQLISGIKYGPDHRFYLSALNGFVYSFEMNAQLKIIGDVCKSPTVGKNRVILGLAFNYADPKVRLYVSTSVLEWKTLARLSGPFAWANGEIHVLEKGAGGKCLGPVGPPIITGLPVSNHDHGVNGLVFDDDGLLHIQVGGFTNAGHNVEDSRLGGIDENPLSGASLVANIYKRNFDGNVTYDTSDPGKARQSGGFDVKVYSPGWRNSFGINIHSNGFLYATDNGASSGFGEMSISCTEHRPLPGNQNLRDKLSKVIKGKYCGHPNRNRGRDDARQCRFIGVKDSAPGYQRPVATFESSTNGVVEYTANTFAGQLKNTLMLSKFATDQSPGKIFRIRLNANGDAASDADVLWEASGVSLEMTPWGDLLTPRVYRTPIVVIRPDSIRTGAQMLVSVMPPRGSAKGGTLVRVTGANIGPSPVAYFGDAPCTEVRVSGDSEFYCRTPAGAPGRAVQVTIRSGSGATTPTAGADFKYMKV